MTRALTFSGSFTQQEAISEEAIARAVDVLRSGRLHRYNLAPGEAGETALLEQEMAASLGVKRCLACASGGYALHIALKAFGVTGGEPVLTNAFTLSPVPGAIDNAGGTPCLVEITRDLVLDLEDLEAKIAASRSRLLLLSHMRGHLVDMEALCSLLEARGVALIEDCAHTQGARWNGKPSGSFGLAACFSTQTYKHMNSGEGGLLVTDDAQLMARATLLSGSYMLYARNGTAPAEESFAPLRDITPNYSGRMDNLRAAILRPQLAALPAQVERWNARYRAVESILRQSNDLYLPERPAVEGYVGSSIQFLVPGLSAAGCQDLLRRCLERGVELKWFGAEEAQGFTSRHQNWAYMPAQALPRSDAILNQLFDMRLPLTFSLEDCRLIAEIILDCHKDSCG
ncbi:MAG: DegT/DnrJ/EryC1/StrS aminotransferase family protein [Pseudomonadota bacterium]